MLTPKVGLFLALGLAGLLYLWVWLSALRRRPQVERTAPTPLHLGIGFVTNFFDTLGIGSFAPTTVLYRLWNQVPDEELPGTLNVGHTLPVIAQAFIYIAIIEVDLVTLLLMIAAAVAGMWVGAGVVVKLPRRAIQVGMGVALLVASGLMLMTIFDQTMRGGDALGLTGGRLAIGLVGNFVLGSLGAIGIGLYGPSLVMISLLGMNPTAAFPIMMGSGAFLMPAGSTRFIRSGSYNVRAALGLALGGIPAVLLAAFIVGSLDLYYVRWLVVLVVLYTAVSLLRAATFERRAARPPVPGG
ncbi:MAG: sulfite exporter TauE/SafE family protein [Gemmatimonadota bacterium]|nr:sulfite exporter TauE/SafE family protein [Gemmatimonadota bacterium]